MQLSLLDWKAPEREAPRRAPTRGGLTKTRPDEKSPICNRCGKTGHYEGLAHAGGCQWRAPHRLPIACCHACATYRTAVGRGADERVLHEQYSSIGAKLPAWLDDGPRALVLPEWLSELRAHNFDKRAALEAWEVESYEAYHDGCGVDDVPARPGAPTYTATLRDGAWYDRFRAELAWSDWPAGAAFVSRADPMSNEAQAEAWGIVETGKEMSR